MKIAISYPPILNSQGQKAMVSQNRNVQYFKKPTYLLPVVHAQAASGLKKMGYEVYWDDGNAQGKTFDLWFSDLIKLNPDIIVFESTTPTMKFYWELSKKVKKALPLSILLLTGYHSMRRPEETYQHSAFDFVLTNQHIDFVLCRLVPLIEKDPNWKNSNELNKIYRKVESLDLAPLVDRDLVQWKNYAYENGNFLQTPGTYATSVIRDCSFGQCTFCRYNGPDLSFSKMSIERSLDEYDKLINQFGVREIFDDSGVWYRGKEARDFALGIIQRGLHKKKCYFGINTRFEYLDEETIKILSKANFRFILLGLEAADNETLEKLKKGYRLENIEHCLKWMKQYGLHPHLTIMVGYYWQTKMQLENTERFVRKLMFQGLARTLQVTLCTPLDFTPYHLECLEKGQLLTQDYNDFDMSRIIVKTPISPKEYYLAIKRMYLIAFHPFFLFRQIIFLFSFRKRDWQFLFTYGIRAVRRVQNHIFNLTKDLKKDTLSSWPKESEHLALLSQS